jgi:uncharacterized protein YndB with AHSA1/START domain
MKPEFVYTIYILAAPDAVWAALRDPEMTKQFWGRTRNVSDWQPGSRWEHQDYDDAATIDVAGTVIESDPPHRLVLSWDSATQPGVSRVTFDLQAFQEATRLTITHEELDAASLKGVSLGWPAILSSLKSLLETGRPLAGTTRRFAWKRDRSMRRRPIGAWPSVHSHPCGPGRACC